MKKLIAFLILSLTACAGTPFKWDDVRQIQPGMTPDEVTKLIGPPTTVSVTGDMTIYAWAHVNMLSSSTKSLSVIFRDGKVSKAPSIPAGFKD